MYLFQIYNPGAGAQQATQNVSIIVEARANILALMSWCFCYYLRSIAPIVLREAVQNFVDTSSDTIVSLYLHLMVGESVGVLVNMMDCLSPLRLFVYIHHLYEQVSSYFYLYELLFAESFLFLQSETTCIFGNLSLGNTETKIIIVRSLWAFSTRQHSWFWDKSVFWVSPA